MRILPILCLLCIALPAALHAEPQAQTAGESSTEVNATETSPNSGIHREVLEYRARWTKLTVGSGRVVVVKTPEYTAVEYRMNFEVKIFGARAYYLDSHQQVLFETDGSLLRSRTAADVNGTKSQGAVELSNEMYEIEFGGKKRQLTPESFVFTTMSSLYRRPITGQWLDLTNGKLVSYDIEAKDNFFDLKRSDGSDELEYNSDDFMIKITSEIKVGSMVLTHQDTAVKELQDLIPTEDQILDDKGFLIPKAKEVPLATTLEELDEDQSASAICSPSICDGAQPS